MLQEQMKAPDFSLPDKEGNIISLGSFSGKKIVLYFYFPADNIGYAFPYNDSSLTTSIYNILLVYYFIRFYQFGQDISLDPVYRCLLLSILNKNALDLRVII